MRHGVTLVLAGSLGAVGLALVGCDSGLPRATFEYRKAYRTARPQRRSLWQALGDGLERLVTHSVSPLRFISRLGAVAGLLNLLYMGYVVGVNLLKQHVMEGWTTLSLQMSLMFFFVFLILVLMAEYLGHILEEARDRPLYHVLEELGDSGSVGSPGLRNVLGHPPPLDSPPYELRDVEAEQPR